MTVIGMNARLVLYYRLGFDAYDTDGTMSYQETAGIILMDTASGTFWDIGDEEVEIDIRVRF